MAPNSGDTNSGAQIPGTPYQIIDFAQVGVLSQWHRRRMRAQLGGVWRRYVYAGERVLEETQESGTPLARYTLASGSYFAPMLHFKHATAGSRWPMYDAIGTARRVVDDSRAVTDAYGFQPRRQKRVEARPVVGEAL